MTADTCTLLAEIGDKEPTLWLCFLLGMWIAIPLSFGLLALRHRSLSFGFFAICALAASVIPLGFQGYIDFVYSMNLEIQDPGLKRYFASEFGPAHIWKMRACVWLGEVVSLACPFVVFDNLWTRRLFARWGNKCICGYSLEGLTTHTCPECGRTLPGSCSSSPPNA